MKFKLVESFEVKRQFKPHTLRLLKLIGSDLLDDSISESTDPIQLKEDINDGTVLRTSEIISGIDGSHLECLIENAIPGTCSFVGQYLDGDSAGTKYTFVYCDDAGSNFAATRFNTTPDQLPTEIFTVDGEDKGSYMIFTDEEIRALDNPSTSITEDIKSNEYIECLVIWKQEDTYYAHSTSASDYEASSLKALLEEVKEGLESESFDFDELVKIENKVTDTQEEFGACGVILAYYKDLEKPLTESNSITSELPPVIDQFLMDIAQCQGGIDYTDISNFGKKATKEQIAKLRSLRRDYREVIQYEGSEEADTEIKDIVDKVVEIVKSEPITEATKWEYEVYADSNSMDEDEFFNDLKSAKKFAIELAAKLKELDPGADVIIKRGLKGDSKPDEWDIITRVNNLTEAVTEVDLVLNDDEVMDLDERTGDITVYDDVIDYTPELPIVFKFAEDEDNIVHKYIMKSHDEEAGTIRLAYNGPDELTEALLMEGPFKAIKNAVANHKADKATKKALEMDKSNAAKEWTYIINGKSMNHAEAMKHSDEERANAIVLDKGFYVRRGTEDLSDRLIRYTKDNAEVTSTYSSKASRNEKKKTEKETHDEEKKAEKAAQKAEKDDLKFLDSFNLRDWAFTAEDGGAVSFGDYIAMNDEKKSRVKAVNRKGEVLDPETLARVTQRYLDKRDHKESDRLAKQQAADEKKQTKADEKQAKADAKAAQKAEDEIAKAEAEKNKNTFKQVKKTLSSTDTSRRTAIKPKGTLTFYPASKGDRNTADTSGESINTKQYAKLSTEEKRKYIGVDSKGSQFSYQQLLNFKKKAKKLKMESLEEAFGDYDEIYTLIEELFTDEEANAEELEESVYTIPGDEVMAGWIDNLSDDQIDSEIANIEMIAKNLGLARPEELVMVVDDDMYYDPANYHFNYVEKTRDGARKYDIEGIEFYIQPNWNGGYYLYFTSEEAANRYAKIVEDENM